MKPRISKFGRKILRNPELSRALRYCIIKKKYKHINPHPMLFTINYNDIKDEVNLQKNN
jgi:hypothetical protein